MNIDISNMNFNSGSDYEKFFELIYNCEFCKSFHLTMNFIHKMNFSVGLFIKSLGNIRFLDKLTSLELNFIDSNINLSDFYDIL